MVGLPCGDPVLGLGTSTEPPPKFAILQICHITVIFDG